MLVHPDGATADQAPPTPRVPAQRTGDDDRAVPSSAGAAAPPVAPSAPPARPRHAAPDATGEITAVTAAGGPVLVSRPPVRGGLDDKTVVLPAFLTGAAPPAPAPSGPTRPDPTAKLPATERGMLVFVAALLGLGTIAVVAMMGMGLTTDKPKAPAPAAASATATASATTSPTPAASPTDSPSPTSSPKPTRTTVAPRVLGSISDANTLTSYCRTWQTNAVAVPPGQTSTTWTCIRYGRGSMAIAPNTVCRWRFDDTTAYTSAKGSDSLPWKCYT